MRSSLPARRPDVFYGSLHVDPGAGWFPHFVGYAEERGSQGGAGSTENRPLAAGTGDTEWLAALSGLAGSVVGFGAEALVVSLGLAAGDGCTVAVLSASGSG